MALIYIIEDDDNIREIEEFALKSAGHQVMGFTYAKDLFRTIEKIIPDLCLVDIMLPDMNGNEIVRKLRNDIKTKKIPVIMVTAKTTDLDLMKGLEDGADDYIKKPFSMIEFMSRVKALLRRCVNEEESEQKLDDLIINHQKREVRLKDHIIDLTYKEYELLSLFVLNHGIVLKRETIMYQVWDSDYEGETRTIDMHVNTLRRKLGEYGNRIRTVRNVGYILE